MRQKFEIVDSNTCCSITTTHCCNGDVEFIIEIWVGEERTYHRLTCEPNEAVAFAHSLNLVARRARKAFEENKIK